MKILLAIYRGVYCGVALVILVALLKGILVGNPAGISEVILSWLLVCAVAFAVVSAFLFSRIAVSLMWLLMLILCGLVAWYGWYGPAAPLVKHELHSFDPAKAAAESRRVQLYASVSYAILVVWFLSLPIVRSINQRRAQVHPTYYAALKASTSTARFTMQISILVWSKWRAERV